MAAINTLRAVLVIGAAVAALFAAVFGQWLAAGILVVGIVGHGLLWWHLYGRSRPPIGPQRPH